MGPPCRYFAGGFCARGNTCRFLHPLTQEIGSTLRPEADEFVPVNTIPICRFFQRKGCLKGEACQFLHPLGCENDVLALPASHKMADHTELWEQTTQRYLKGVLATFGDGAEVVKLEPPHIVANRQLNGLHEKVRLSTLLCMWHSLSKVVWVRFNRKKLAQDALHRFSNNGLLHGRKLGVWLPDPLRAPRRKSKVIWSVGLRNVHPNTTKVELDAVLKGIQYQNIVFGKANTTLSEQQVNNRVKSILGDSGREIEYFDVVSQSTSGLIKAYVGFTNPSHARCTPFANRRWKEIGSYIYSEARIAIRIRILHEIYTIIASGIHLLRTNCKDDVWIAYPSYRGVQPVVIRVVGSDATAVAKVKSSIEYLLVGRVILNDQNGALWDNWYGTTGGMEELRHLSQPGKLFIYRDVRKRQLTFHGDMDLLEPTRDALNSATSERSRWMHFIPLDPGSHRNSFGQLLDRLKARFGKERVELETNKLPPHIYLVGNAQDVQLAKDIIVEVLLPSQDLEESKTIIRCPVCLVQPEQAIKLRCGHHYCQLCFEAQCKAAEANQIPIICFGESGVCKQVVCLQDLQYGLCHVSFEALLETAVEAYIRSRPEEFQYCPTPDCPNIYAVSANGTLVTCEQCLNSVCTSCKTVNHEPMNCEEARQIQATQEQERFLQQYQQENDARRCPRCPAIIERTQGCNHMECINCHAHICWVRDCMQAFDSSGECYGHLELVHGSYVDEPEELEDDLGEDLNGSDYEDEGNLTEDPDVSDEDEEDMLPVEQNRVGEEEHEMDLIAEQRVVLAGPREADEEHIRPRRLLEGFRGAFEGWLEALEGWRETLEGWREALEVWLDEIQEQLEARQRLRETDQRLGEAQARRDEANGFPE